MKQFNLEEYLANPSRKVVTRDGRDVRIICTDFDNPNYPGICEIKGSKWPYSFATNGELIKGKKLSGDLFFAPEKKEGWINIFKVASNDNRFVGGARIFKSKEEAEEAREGVNGYITTMKIEWEEA